MYAVGWCEKVSAGGQDRNLNCRVTIRVLLSHLKRETSSSSNPYPLRIQGIKKGKYMRDYKMLDIGIFGQFREQEEKALFSFLSAGWKIISAAGTDHGRIVYILERTQND